MALEVNIGDQVRLKKQHPCGGYYWRVTRWARTLACYASVAAAM